MCISGDLALLSGFKVDVLTVTGQDCLKGRSVGSFVASLVERVIERSALASISWAGTATKAAFNEFDLVIAVIKGRKD